MQISAVLTEMPSKEILVATNSPSESDNLIFNPQSKLSRTTRSPGYLWDFRQDHVGIYKLPHSFRFFVVAGVSKEYETDATKSSHVNPTMLRAESA